jgi:hypothetical protein
MYPSATQRHLEESEHDDAGRGLEFAYFQVEGGAQLAALTAMSESGTLLPSTGKNSGLGPYFGGAAGIRLLFLTVGPRFRYAHFTDWDLWTLNLDLGWHVPLGNLEPYAVLGGGFAKVGRSAEGVTGLSDVPSITGFNVRLGSGLDYYLSNVFSVGAAVQLDFLRLSRSPTTIGLAPSPQMPVAPASFEQSASSLGLVLNAGVVLGLHF